MPGAALAWKPVFCIQNEPGLQWAVRACLSGLELGMHLYFCMSPKQQEGTSETDVPPYKNTEAAEQ